MIKSVQTTVKQQPEARKILPQSRPQPGSFAWSLSAIIGLVLFVAVIVAVIFAPLLTPYDPNQQDLLARLQLPTTAHPLGTDHLGRDVLARLLYGGRFSLTLTTAAVITSGLIGTVVGALAGRVGGLVDEMVMRTVDLIIAFPAIIMALIIATLMKPGVVTLVLAVTLTGWTTFARLARAVTLDVGTQNYILAATAVGVPEWRILFNHIVPNIIGAILAMSFLRFGHLLLIIAGLSYLGLGAQPPTPDWGAMLAEAQPYMQRVPSLILAPGLTIFITALCVSLAGQGLNAMLDPKQRQATQV